MDTPIGCAGEAPSVRGNDMDVVTVAVAIVAAFLGGGAFWLANRAGAGAWLSFTLGLLVFALAFAAGPGLLRLG